MTAFLRARPDTPILLLALSFLALPAQGEEAGRFLLKETGQNTLIRLDTVTGAVSHCSSAAGEWSCKSVSDDRAELHEEIARLKKENGELKAKLARSRNAAPETPLTLPSEADLDRIMTLFEKYLERFLTFIRRFEQKNLGEPI
jgi:hypothetical protein